MKYYLSILLLLLILPASHATAQADDSWKLYSDTSLARVDITIDTSYLSWIYAHVDSDSEFYAQIHFHNSWIDESVDSIGFRLRGNTSRDAQKKSFKVSFNSFIKGRRFHGVKKLNLNGEHNDPSIIRSKLCFDLYQDIGMAASRVAHTRVYINGVYYGLYVSVEDVGEDFLTKRYKDDTGNLWKCLYPADLQYIGEDPAAYAAITSDGRPAYELQANETKNDFSQIVRLARILHQTPSGQMADSLEAVVDVPTVLKYFAMDVLMGSWDEYRSLMNNYYLYHNPTENRLTIIPYDYDNTFGVDWFSIDWSAADPYNFPKVASGARPLSEALLAQNQYRDLFTHFLKFYNTNLMPLSRWESRINRIRDTISAAAIADSFRTLDYGFTVNDFYNSYSAIGYQNQHVKFGLKQFVNLRTASLAAQLSFTGASAQAYNISISSNQPGPHDSVAVTAACFGNAGVKKVEVLYTPKDSVSPRVYAMQFSPIAGTTIAENADRWVANLPPLGYSAKGTIRVRVADSLDRVQITPRVTPIAIQTPGLASGGLVLNELLADNTNTLADQNGEYDDWLELYNPTTSPILLIGLYLTDNPAKLNKWRFTQSNLTIAAGEHLLVWCDDQQTQTGIHTNFKFSKSGEYAALVDTDGVTVIDSLSFGPQDSDISLGRFPDGALLWGKMNPTPQAANSNVHGTGVVQIRIAKGWNMISVPMKVTNGKASILYPGAASGAFLYRAGYQAIDSLLPGTGYWLKFDSARAYEIPGTVIAVETVAVRAGWNMIGSASQAALVSSITSLTTDLTTSSFFGYENEYFATDTLQPGKGYWVKASISGMLRIAAGSAAPLANRLRILAIGELPPPPPGSRTSDGIIQPKSFELGQNFPNPFNPTTVFNYSLPEDALVHFTIFNVLGQKIETLADGIQSAGYKSLAWNAREFPSGIYLYRLDATSISDSRNSFRQQRKMVLIK